MHTAAVRFGAVVEKMTSSWPGLYRLTSRCTRAAAVARGRCTASNPRVGCPFVKWRRWTTDRRKFAAGCTQGCADDAGDGLLNGRKQRDMWTV